MSTTASPPPTWADTYANVSTGVVRLDNICDSGGNSSTETGTGFLVAPNMVATVAHVVEHDGALRVTSPTSGISTTGQVIGFDHDDDLALVRTDVPLAGHRFRFAPATPGIGTEMGAIGFPLARSMQLTTGHITGTHDHRYVGGEFDLSDVLLSDAALNPGNSGGPWLTIDGAVIALDESGPPTDSNGQRAQGTNGGVSGIDAAARFTAWQLAPTTQPDRGCQPADAATAAVETLQLYFYAINSSDYATAYAQLNPDNHPLSGLQQFTAGLASTTDSASDGSDAYFTLDSSGTAGGRTYLDVSFQSSQHAAQGQNGETCTNWTLRYWFTQRNGLQLIDSSPPAPGTNGHTAC